VFASRVRFLWFGGFALQPVVLARDGCDLRVVQETVQDGRGSREISDQFTPVFQRSVGSHQNLDSKGTGIVHFTDTALYKKPTTRRITDYSLSNQLLSAYMGCFTDRNMLVISWHNSCKITNMDQDAKRSPLTGQQLLDMYFLEMRCHLLEVAAGFDRIQRAQGGESALNDARAEKLRAALAVLASASSDRAERFLDLFSE